MSSSLWVTSHRPVRVTPVLCTKAPTMGTWPPHLDCRAMEEHIFAFHNIECQVGVSLTWGAQHQDPLHEEGWARWLHSVCGCYFDTTCISIVADPFWKWHFLIMQDNAPFHDPIMGLELLAEHRDKFKVLTWTPYFPDLIGGSGDLLIK